MSFRNVLMLQCLKFRLLRQLVKILDERNPRTIESLNFGLLVQRPSGALLHEAFR